MLILAAVLFSPVFSFSLEKADVCKSYCLKTFNAHTTANEAEGLDGCNQGCSLYSLIDYTKSAEENKTGVQQECRQECEKDMKSEGMKNGCLVGCGHQAPFQDTGHMEFSFDSRSPLYHYAHRMLDRVSDDMETFGQSVQNKMFNMFDSDFDAGFNRDIQNAQSMMQRLQQQFRQNVKSVFGFDPLTEDRFLQSPAVVESSSDSKSKEQLKMNPLFNYASNLGRQDYSGKHEKAGFDQIYNGPTVDNFDNNGRMIMKVHVLPLDFSEQDETTKPEELEQGTFDEWYDKPHEPSPPVDTRDVEPCDGWLAYLARRTSSLSSSTRWLLFCAMIICVASMLWICMLILRTMPPHRVAKAYFPQWVVDRRAAKQSGAVVAEDGEMEVCGDKKALVQHAAPVEGFDAPPPYSPPPAEVHKTGPSDQAEK